MPSSKAAPAGASCWICLEEGPDNDDKPLMRGCSCRGDSAGFAHVACVAGYAQRKSEEAYEKAARTNDFQSSNIPWMDCPNCKQGFRGEMALELAKARRDIIRAEEISESDFRSLSTFFLLANAHKDVGDFTSAKELEEQCLEIMRANPTLPHIPSLRLEMLQSLIQTLTNFEDDKGILDCLYERRAVASSNPAFAPRLYDTELQIKLMEKKISGTPGSGLTSSYLRSRYEMSQQSFGRQSDTTLLCIPPLASALANEGKVEEAVVLVENGMNDAKRFLGPDHPTAKLLETRLHEIKTQHHKTQRAKLVSDDPNLNGKDVQILRATKDGAKYIIAFDRKGETKKVKVPPSKLVLAQGTPVVCQGLVSAQQMNGRKGKVQSFAKDKGRYAVVFEGNPSSLVKPENLGVLFF